MKERKREREREREIKWKTKYKEIEGKQRGSDLLRKDESVYIAVFRREDTDTLTGTNK